MNIKGKLEEARKCINQALIGIGEKKEDDVFEIRIPNLRPDETKAVRAAINVFVQELLNKLTFSRNNKGQK